MLPLPVVPVISCQGCGKCCQTQGSPPDLLWDYETPGVLRAAKAARLPLSGWPLSEWGRSLPPEALAALLAYHERGVYVDGPCVWYDTASGRCRWYEWRPEACREMEVGGEDCLAWRGPSRDSD
jgi:uncharacterized protein